MTFNNYNTVDIQAGILDVNGGYISTAGSLLHCALGGTTAGTGYGRLQIAGTVALNGALSVSLANGFLPAINDAFTVQATTWSNETLGVFAISELLSPNAPAEHANRRNARDEIDPPPFEEVMLALCSKQPGEEIAQKDKANERIRNLHDPGRAPRHPQRWHRHRR